MRASLRSSSSSILVLLGTGALLVLIVIAITGGFTIRAGILRVSAHSVVAAALVCAGTWLLAAVLDRGAAGEAASCVFAGAERRGAALAIVCAAAAAGNSLAFGSYSAAGADAGGYLSQASMLAAGRVVRTEPLSLQAGWPEPELSFSPLGYRPGLAPGNIVPTYPPGLPLVFAAAQRTMGEFGPYVALSLLSAAAVLGAYALGRALHSSLAGAVAAALTATSPIFIIHSLVPMSDVPATAWWALALVSALRPDGRRRGAVSALAAGALTGLAVLTRPNLIPLALVVCAALLRGDSHRGRRLALYVLGGVPAALVLLAIQWRIFGTPFASGHGSFDYLFSLGNVLPNIRDYALRVATGEWPAVLLAVVSLLASRSLARRPDTLLPSPQRAGLMASLATAAILFCYLPYGVFPDWTYLRFLLPAFPVLFAAVGAATVCAASRLPSATRGIALLAVVTLACALNVSNARRLGAFELRRNEGRYETTGRYLAAALPADAVIVTAQESTSAWHYTGLPVVRWDLLDIELDAAIERLRGLGRRPVLLVEDWEAADLRRKFPRSATAQLDWRPRADIGDPVRVRLFDPADRLTGAAAWPIDRLHVE